MSARSGQSERRMSDQEPIVRWAEIGDAADIARTVNASWRTGYRGLIPDEMLDSLDDARSTTQWLQRLRDGYEYAGQRAHVQVATDAEGQVVGVSMFGGERDPDTREGRGELWALYIAPSHWDRGYGRSLLRAAEAHLASSGLRDLVLWVLEDNARARHFYEVAGWQCDDVKKPFGDSGADEVRYSKQP